jgi:hypothetical protein
MAYNCGRGETNQLSPGWNLNNFVDNRGRQKTSVRPLLRRWRLIGYVSRRITSDLKA